MRTNATPSQICFDFTSRRSHPYPASHLQGGFMSRAHVSAVSAFLMALALFAPAVRGDIPGAADPKARTRHDFIRTRLAFNQRTLAGAYQAVGKRDPKWDDAAVKFLDAMAVYYTYMPE